MPTLPAVTNPVGAPPTSAAAPNTTPSLTQILIAFTVGPRPSGTPGKKPFFMREVLGLNGPEYMIVLNAMRDIARALGFDFAKSLTKQNVNVVRRICEMAVDVFPRLNDFSHLANPYWVPEAFLQVMLKSASDRRRYLAKAQAAARIAPESPREVKKRRAARQETARRSALARSAARRAAASQASGVPANEDDSVEVLLQNISIHDNDDDDDEPAPVAAPVFGVNANLPAGFAPPAHHPATAAVYAPPPEPNHPHNGYLTPVLAPPPAPNQVYHGHPAAEPVDVVPVGRPPPVPAHTRPPPVPAHTRPRPSAPVSTPVSAPVSTPVCPPDSAPASAGPQPVSHMPVNSCLSVSGSDKEVFAALSSAEPSVLSRLPSILFSVGAPNPFLLTHDVDDNMELDDDCTVINNRHESEQDEEPELMLPNLRGKKTKKGTGNKATVTATKKRGKQVATTSAASTEPIQPTEPAAPIELNTRALRSKTKK